MATTVQISVHRPNAQDTSGPKSPGGHPVKDPAPSARKRASAGDCPERRYPCISPVLYRGQPVVPTQTWWRPVHRHERWVETLLTPDVELKGKDAEVIALQEQTEAWRDAVFTRPPVEEAYPSPAISLPREGENFRSPQPGIVTSRELLLP